MKYLVPPLNQTLSWYLAMEEYVAVNLDKFIANSDENGVFFTWIVSPTVIYGRHQVPENEVDLEFCKEHGIQIVQRKSGGGCVYADRGNLMLSYIVKKDTHNAQEVFQLFLDIVAEVLRNLGLDAVKTEHNDILVDGLKVSGNACYTLKNAIIVHGTMLYNEDFDMMQRAITPTKEKLEKHGVKSVRQRVVNLADKLDNNLVCNINALSDFLVKKLCVSQCELTQYDLEQISTLEKENY